MATIKPGLASSLTPMKIVGSLRRGGFEASKRSTTAVRGWGESTSGFRCSFQWPRDGSIMVTWHIGSHFNRHSKAYELAKLQEMEKWLVNDGFLCDERPPHQAFLLVRLKPANSQAGLASGDPADLSGEFDK